MNIQLERFLETIRGEGHELALNFEAPRWKGDKGRVRHYSVSTGPEDRKPAASTIVVIEYPNGDGFDVYAHVTGMQITDCVAAVIGIPADEVSLVA